MASPKKRAAAEVEGSNNEDAGKVTCLYDNLKCFRHLYSVIRDRESDRPAFVRAATKIMSIIWYDFFSFPMLLGSYFEMSRQQHFIIIFFISPTMSLMYCFIFYLFIFSYCYILL
jgi:hypothetical protein